MIQSSSLVCAPAQLESFKKQFSFNRLFNTIKGISRPVMKDKVNENWLKTADKATRERFAKFNTFCKNNGIEHPKIKYPVMFGHGKNGYLGCMATEDIGKDEVIVKVPSNLIITTKNCYQCDELQPVYFEHPELFGKHVQYGDDNVMAAFILYQISLGEKSRFYEQIMMWPKNADILMNWNDEDLEWL